MNPTQYTDCYFTKTKEAATHNPIVEYQVFQKHSAILAGIELTRGLFAGKKAEVHSLADGTVLAGGECVMTIKAHIQEVAELETLYLGMMDECTRVATEVRKAVKAANGKPVLFFPARFAAPEVQYYHGFAAGIGGAIGCSTQEQTKGFLLGCTVMNRPFNSIYPVGTMPHAMIAAFMGDTAAACLAFAKARPDEDIWALVDFHNDCAKTAIECAKALEDKGLKLAGVRLDTSEKLEDNGLAHWPGFGTGRYKGVCPELVQHVRDVLDSHGFKDVKICVSGGFTPAKIELFERMKAAVDVYAIGEGFLKTTNAFTSDICRVMQDGEWVECHKVGRPKLDDSKLTYRMNTLQIPVTA